MKIIIDLPSSVTCAIAARAQLAVAARRDCAISTAERHVLADAAEMLLCVEDALADHEAEGADDILPRCATCGASPIDCGHLPRPDYAAIEARHSRPSADPQQKGGEG